MKMKRNNYKKEFNKMMGDPLSELELVSPKAKKTTMKEVNKVLNQKIKIKKYGFAEVEFPKDEVEVTKKSTDYRLKLGKYKIFATVSDKGISLHTMQDDNQFVFMDSQPDLMENMGKLIVRASQLK